MEKRRTVNLLIPVWQRLASLRVSKDLESLSDAVEYLLDESSLKEELKKPHVLKVAV